MRNKILLLSVLVMLGTLTTAAQKFTKWEDDTPVTVEKTEKQAKTAKAKKEKKQKEVEVVVPKVEAKYFRGAVPTVDGKVVWTTSINLDGITAEEAYQRTINFLKTYCKEKGKDKSSSIAAVNKEDHQVGARIKEDVVFTDKGLVLDKAVLNYTLIVDCKEEGRCTVTMCRMTYTYEKDRGGGTFPAEDMLTDENAINKKGDNFRREGFAKFRIKTIDCKDRLFQRITEAVTQTAATVAE